MKHIDEKLIRNTLKGVRSIFIIYICLKHNYIYLIKLFAQIYIYVYINVLAIADQTAELNWMNFFEETH